MSSSSCARVVTPPAAARGSGVPALQRKCAPAKSPQARGNEAPCAECHAEAMQRGLGQLDGPPPPAQKPDAVRFEVGAPDDALEREADRVAQQVMNGSPAPSTSADGSDPKLRRLPAAAPNLTHAPEGVQQVLSGPGRPLDARTRAFFEPRFGRDFSSVRVHTSDTADRSARALDAQAYTVGHHVVFSRGADSPSTETGRRVLAHELAHVVQQSHSPGGTPGLQRKKGGRGPGSCGLLSAATATLLGKDAHTQIQNRLIGRGLAKEMPIPRATKEIGRLGSRKCQPLGTHWGFADVARIARPVVSLSEIKPYWKAGIAGRFEVQHYRLRAEQSRQRLTGTGSCGRGGADADDHAFNATVGPLTASSTFDLLRGAIAGTEDFGPFQQDRYRNLLAKEVGAGAIGYWCRLNDEGKKKKKEEQDKKKRAKERREKEKAEKKRRAQEKERKAVEKEKPRENPKDKPKPKKKPKAPKPTSSASGGLGNFGFGISIFGSSVGGANVGVGLSVGSDGAAMGTAGASVSWFSDGVAVGAIGAVKSKGTTSAGAGVASVGEAENTQSAAAGAASQGEIKDSTVAGAGGTGSGKVQGATGAGAGSLKKAIDPKDVTGPDADKVPPGESDEDVAPEGGKPGQPHAGEGNASANDRTEGGEGQRVGQGESEAGGEQSQPGQPRDGQQLGGEGSQSSPPATGSTSDPGGQPGQQQVPDGVKPSPRADAGTGPVKLGVLPVVHFDASETDRENAAAEAAKVALLLKNAEDAQKLLLHHLASKEANGQYMVPASDWVQKLLNATKGLAPDDIEYLAQLDWRPGSISEQELRRRVLEALANRHKPKPTGTGAAVAPAKTPGDGAGGGKGGGEGGGEGAREGIGKTDRDTQGARGEIGGGPKGDSKSPAQGSSSRVTDPPAGSSRDDAGIFSFKILAGITSTNYPEPGKAVECKVLIVEIEEQGRTFELDGVSITFVGKEPDKEIVEAGVTYISTVFKLRFTKDFWSEKYKFYGKGGAESLTDYEWRRKKGK